MRKSVPFTVLWYLKTNTRKQLLERFLVDWTEWKFLLIVRIIVSRSVLTDDHICANVNEPAILTNTYSYSIKSPSKQTFCNRGNFLSAFLLAKWTWKKIECWEKICYSKPQSGESIHLYRCKVVNFSWVSKFGSIQKEIYTHTYA
jgi:hypothetical protein